jgi:urease accessory protein
VIAPVDGALGVAGREAGPSRVGRDGGVRLAFDRRGTRTVLVGCGSTLPLQVLCPLPLDDPAAIVSVLNPTGGVVGGDRMAIDVDVRAGAHACLTTPSATKVYRTAGPTAVQTVALRIGAGAALEWAPDHTIPFAGSAYAQVIHADLEPGARLILVDAFAAGRVARGEAWAFRLLDSALRIRDARGWLLVDRFRLEGCPRWSGVGATDGHPYLATVVVARGRAAGTGSPDSGRPADDGACAADRRVAEALRDAVRGIADRHVGVAALPHAGVFVRCLARTAPGLLDTVDTLWQTARRTLLGLPPLHLRKL